MNDRTYSKSVVGVGDRVGTVLPCEPHPVGWDGLFRAKI